jgi:hypothetical protein
MTLHHHTASVCAAVESWLQPDNDQLREAIRKTVDGGYFSEADIRHQIRHLKHSVTPKNIGIWAEKSELQPGSLAGKRVLCLHAGNLPLVGFQDVLAVALTGAAYSGKISRKDPWLLPSLIHALREKGVFDESHYALTPEDLPAKPADAVLFSGAEESVQIIRKKLKEHRLADDQTPFLRRTAGFSIAWIDDNSRDTMESLTEAVFRYGGNGCRSVAVVVAPFRFTDHICGFTDYVESFWLANPQHQKPPPSLFHRYAYNRAMGISQSWLHDFLIEDTMQLPDHKFVLHWVEGGGEELRQLIEQAGHRLQSVYGTAHAGSTIAGRTIEPLSSAQAPPVWWKPDGTDPVRWLWKQLS